MSKFRAAAAIVVISICASSAKAETAQEMYSVCRTVADARTSNDGQLLLPNDPNTAKCWGAFAAVQGFLAIVEHDGSRILGACAPETVTRTQIVRIYQKYVSERPEQGHLSFAYMVQAAMMTAFPCPKR